MSTALYPSLDALSEGLQALRGRSPEYVDRMLHTIPQAPSVQRVPWLVNRLAGKTVLHVGCVGKLHEQLLKVCARVYGVDQDAANYPDYVRMDLERDCLPAHTDVTVVLLGEVLEHLVSPGALLQHVRDYYPEVEVIVTVPNAFSQAAQQWIKRGVENVNADHCYWLSYKTLHTLVEKCGYDVREFLWADGPALVSEGLIAVCRARGAGAARA